LAGRGYFSKAMNVDINSELKAWLESEPKDIDKGISLFQRFSRNRALALYLIRKRDLKKLIYEIEKLSKLKLLKPSVPAKNIDTTHAAEGATNEKKFAKTDRNSLPDDLKEVFDQITEAYKTQRVFHEKMKLAATDEDRAAMRAEVVALDDLIAEGWDKIDAFAKQGPDNSDKTKSDDPADQAKKITAARTAISRGLKNYDKSKKPKLVESINTLIALNASVKLETRAKLVELNVIKEDSNLLGK
jgi:hypothetical protein